MMKKRKKLKFKIVNKNLVFISLLNNFEKFTKKLVLFNKKTNQLKRNIQILSKF